MLLARRYGVAIGLCGTAKFILVVSRIDAVRAAPDHKPTEVGVPVILPAGPNHGSGTNGGEPYFIEKVRWNPFAGQLYVLSGSFRLTVL